MRKARRKLRSLAHALGVYVPLLQLQQRTVGVKARHADRLREIDFYRHLIPTGRVIFDVGAFRGKKTDIFRCCASKVVAVEPQPSCVDYLRERFSDVSGIVIEDAAVSSTCGIATLHVGTHGSVSTLSRSFINNTNTTRRLEDTTWNEEVTVSTMTLDTLIEQHGLPTFCKIDVEGHEHEALHGLSKAIPFLSFEITRGLLSEAIACLDHLEGIGSYEYNFSSIEGVPELLYPNWHDARESRKKIQEWSFAKRHLKLQEKADVYARLSLAN